MASDSSSEDSESVSSSERDSRSTLSSEEDSFNDTLSNHSSMETKNKKLSERLCDCTNTTIGDVVFMCLVLGIRHNLIWEAQLDILQMVNSIYDKEDIPQSTNTFNT